MDEHRKLEVALDGLAGQFGLLVAAAEGPTRVRDAEVDSAVHLAREAFASVNEIAAGLDDDDDLAAIASLWDAIAVVQDQVRRAHDAVRNARATASRYAEIRDSAQQARADSRRAREDRRAARPEPLTILVVDDVADTRRMYTTYFEHAGARVLGAANGREALDVLDTQRPDVVLLDLSMPGADGWDALAAMRGDARWRDVAIAILTGCAEPHDSEAARVAGADLFLTKPCLPHVVFRLLVQLVRRQSDRV